MSRFPSWFTSSSATQYGPVPDVWSCFVLNVPEPPLAVSVSADAAFAEHASAIADTAIRVARDFRSSSGNGKVPPASCADAGCGRTSEKNLDQASCRARRRGYGQTQEKATNAAKASANWVHS